MSAESITPLTQLTGARQTMASWSKRIESIEAVPEIYRGYFKPVGEAGEAFPYTLLSPSLEKFLRKTPEHLTYESGETLHILERAGRQVIAQSYPYQTIHWMEVGNILLSSWLTLSGLTSEGSTSSSTIDFNAATGERLLAPFLNKMRPLPREVDEAQFSAEKAKFDFLAPLNFKFMNYGRHSLVRGEKALQILFQPEIREPAGSFLGWTRTRAVSLAHLVILTDQELILIRDDERGKEIRGVRYGCVWKYIPFRSLRTVTLAETTENRLSLNLALPEGETLQKIFDASRRAELEQFRDKIKALIESPGT